MATQGGLGGDQSGLTPGDTSAEAGRSSGDIGSAAAALEAAHQASTAAFFAPPTSKPFLGGYRNLGNGTIFHHTNTQTEALSEEERQRQQRRQLVPQVSSSVQTGHPRSRGVQCPRDASTQCPRPGQLDETQGREVELTAAYETAERVAALRGRAALTIQSCARGWLARQHMAALRQVRTELKDFLEEEHTRQAAASDETAACEVQRRMQPRTQQDFNLLLEELAMWWGQEQTKIAATHSMTEDERQVARRALLAKETKLLQTIDRLRLAAVPILRAERVGRQLAAMSAPKCWPIGNGRVAEVDTPGTLWASELAATYHQLVANGGSNLDARLSALLAVKQHVKALDCSLTREIVGLVDREADLLNRGRDPSSMAGLRTRLANAFLQLIQMEQFNPAATVLRQARGNGNSPGSDTAVVAG